MINYTLRCPDCEGKLGEIIEKPRIQHPIPQTAVVRICGNCITKWMFYMIPKVKGGVEEVQKKIPIKS